MELNEEHKDVQLLKNGAIHKYFRNKHLDEDVIWLSDHRFEIRDMNCSKWNRKNFHKKLKEELDFPDYYGENLDAFDDCLGDMYDKRYRGLVLVFRNYDDFLNHDRKRAEAILDSIARESRLWLLTGQKLLGLVQSNDPHLVLPKLGGISPDWNACEWLNADREE